MEIIAESSLVTSPIFSKTRRGHGARVHQPPRKKNFHNGVSTFLQKNPYSLLVDESTDVASMKQLCVVVRYFDDALNRVSARFFSLIDVPIADAATLYDSFRQALKADEVPLSSIVGYASDGANVMMGCNNSFRTRLEAVNPNIFVMKCICHSAHLVASNACTKLPRQAEDFVRDIYSYFNHSARRSVDLSEFQHFTGTEPHKLLHPCQTRWLSLQQCVKRILEQWQALTVYFAHSAREDKLLKAERLHGFLSNPHFKIFFIFLNFILPKFTEFNLLFQSSAPNLHLLNKKVQLLYKELLGYYMQPTYLRDTNLTVIDPEARRFMLPINSIYLGVYVAAELARPEILGKIDLVEEFLTRSRDFFPQQLYKLSNVFL